ncbi:MAG TPA: asparaginase, partial [Gemmatimonadales bacterium]|nr:asparaginase [Gemmatimonadales bacterium]
MSLPFQVQTTRGAMVESVHRVSCVVRHRSGAVVATSGETPPLTWWRSAAKPFQALPLVQDGGAERFALDNADLAIACASHSSEPGHLAAVERFMAKVGVSESDLVCGPHPPLSAEVHRGLLRSGQEPTPRWSNCSGKHTAMLALARLHGWSLEGYHEPNHPVQLRIAREIASWAEVPPESLAVSTDGCATTCFGLPLEGMALAWARLGASPEPATARLRASILANPWLIAGTGRPCTEIMEAWPDQVMTKIGAEGVYGAAIPALELGIALKVDDGDMRASAIALVAVLQQL